MWNQLQEDGTLPASATASQPWQVPSTTAVFPCSTRECVWSPFWTGG